MAHNHYLKVLFVTNGIFVFAASLLGPLYAVFVQKLGNGILTISATYAAELLSATVFTIILSRLHDKFIRHEALLLIGFLIRAVIWITFMFIHSLPELMILQVALGIGDAVGSPAFNSFFAEHLDKDKHLQEYADWQVLNNVAVAASTIVGGFIASLFGFPMLFLTMALLACIAAIILIKNLLLEAH